MKSIAVELAGGIKFVESELSAAVDAESKKNVLEACRTIVDKLIEGHPFATTIVDFLFAKWEASIK